MKIEKINDNQIRCVLSISELRERNINLDELAYGSDKARSLFFDMLNKAKHDLDFDATNAPIMVEAVPSVDELILLITKVSDIDELDARFSRFSQSPSGASDHVLTGADNIINLLKKGNDTASINITVEKKLSGDSNSEKTLPEGLSKLLGSLKGDSPDSETPSRSSNLVQAYRFNDLDTVINASKAVSISDNCENALYKCDEQTYMLIVHISESDPEAFNRLCNVLIEYGAQENISDFTEYYLKEHDCTIIAKNALQNLRKIG